MSTQVKIYKSDGDLFYHSANAISRLINEFIQLNGKCTLVLSGGSTPKNVYQILSGESFNNIKWNDVYFFWGDERCVPPDNNESNFKMANNTLLSKINIPERNIFRIKTEYPHDIGAKDYNRRLKEFFPNEVLPSFDIFLLGLGEDGHIASLFSGSTAMQENKKWVVDNFIQKLDKWRITMTLLTINSSKNIIFIVKGSEKATAIKNVIVHKNSNFPGSFVEPSNGNLTWHLDSEAAALIR